MNHPFKRLATILAFTLACLTVAAQTKPEYHLISLSSNDPDAAVPMRFYVAGVYDGRQFTDNIGTVQKGIGNRQVLANFEKPFVEELTAYLTTAYPKADNLPAVWVRINDIYVSEYTDKNSETGYASAVMDVMVKRNDTLFIEGTFGGNIEGTGSDVTKKHPLRIKQALNKCLGLYEVVLPEDKVNEVFSLNNSPKEVPVKPAAGVYSSYLDMVKGKPMAGGNYYLQPDKDKTRNKYYVMNRTNSQRCDNFYAYSDGENVYLNVTRFTNEKYYAKTDRIANKYFIDKIVYNQRKAVLQVAMYTSGNYIVGSMVETTMPLMVDCNSGQPFFLSNNGIKTLLEPNPQLYTEYKKSKKTPEEIKAIITKYYQQNSGK